MILTVNIGNTHITVGGYEQDTLIFCGRLHSDPAATVEEYAIRLVNLLQLYGASPAQIEGGILGSVVPMLSGRVLAALQLLCKARILTVGPGLKSGWTTPRSWAQSCCAARWRRWQSAPGRWWSSRQTRPSP